MGVFGREWDVPDVLEVFDEVLLVLGRHAGEDFGADERLVQQRRIVLAQQVEGGTVHRQRELAAVDVLQLRHLWAVGRRRETLGSHRWEKTTQDLAAWPDRVLEETGRHQRVAVDDLQVLDAVDGRRHQHGVHLDDLLRGADQLALFGHRDGRLQVVT